MDSARTKLLLREPFWGALALLLDLKPGEPGSRACTDGKVIKFDPAFIAKLPDEVLLTLVREEVEHVARGHLHRAPAGVTWSDWNAACDNEILNQVADENEAEQARGRSPMWPLLKDSCCDRSYKGMAAEAIYVAMQRRKQAQNGGGDKGQPKPGESPSPSSGGAGQPDPSQSQPQPNGAGSPPQNPPPNPSGAGQGNTPGSGPTQGAGSKPEPQPPGLGDFEPLGGESCSESERAELAGEWDRQILAAARTAKARGALPSGMARIVDEIVHPTEDPLRKLQEWLTDRSRDDYNWMVPNARYSESEFFLPSLDAPKAGRIVFARDTSGSIDEALLARMRGIMQWALDELKPTSLAVVDYDSRVHGMQEFEPGDEIAKTDVPKGGGGTAFGPVFKYLEEQEASGEHAPVRALVYLTDLDGRFPSDAPEYPVVWVTWDPVRTAPFGEIVRV